MFKINWQTIRFIITGATGALIYFLGTYLLLKFAHWPAYLSSISGFFMAFSFSYLGQKYWAFRSDEPHSRTLTRYSLLQAFCLVFGAVITQLMATKTMLSAFYISLISTFCTSLVSYLGSSLWVFTDASPQKDEANALLNDKGADTWLNKRKVLFFGITITGVCVIYLKTKGLIPPINVLLKFQIP